MAQGKQAKTLSEKQAKVILSHLETTRYPARDRVMFMLSLKAGLRSKEIAELTWSMVTDAAGIVADRIELPNRASKGKGGGRTIPLHPELQAALVVLHGSQGSAVRPGGHVIHSERRSGMTAGSVTVWFHRLFAGLGYQGCSSHSGRRTFITKAAKKIVEAGGSLRDVQQLAGHTNLGTTQRYIEGDSDAKRKVVSMI